MYNMILLILFTWRVSAFLVYDPITKNLRDRAGVGMTKGIYDDRPISFGAWILGCFWCCSLVVATLVNLLAPCAGIMDVILRPIAVSGGAILVHYACRIHLQLSER